jgi:hypothetical protein
MDILFIIILISSYFKFILQLYFLKDFLFLAGPEGLDKKTFKIWTRYNYKASPRGCPLISVLRKGSELSGVNLAKEFSAPQSLV